MAGEEQDPGLLQRLLRLVTSPVTDMADLTDDLPASSAGSAPPTAPTREDAASRGELLVMLERKRRNDFVRKQELDLLRQVRRGALSAEKLEMLRRAQDAAEAVASGGGQPEADSDLRKKIDALEQSLTPAAELAAGPAEANHSPYGATEPLGLVPTPLSSQGALGLNWPVDCADPMLVDAALFFANGDFTACEREMRRWLSPGGERAFHAPTWRVLLDLYRAVGQRQRFEAAAADFSRVLHEPEPPWVSIPVVAKTTSQSESGAHTEATWRDAGLWICPPELNAQAIQELQVWTARLRSLNKEASIDWGSLQTMDGPSAALLVQWLDQCGEQGPAQRWKHTAALRQLVEFATDELLQPASDTASDDAFWRLHLSLLRALGEETAHQVLAQAHAQRKGGAPQSWAAPAFGALQEQVDSEIPESSVLVLNSGLLGMAGSADRPEVTLKMLGQVCNGLPAPMRHWHADRSTTLIVDCSGLIRLDLAAAGELMTWAKDQCDRDHQVHLRQVHRLVGLFLFSMGLARLVNLEARPL